MNALVRELDCSSCRQPLAQSDMDRYTRDHVAHNGHMECFACRSVCLNCGKRVLTAEDIAKKYDVCEPCAAEIPGAA